MKYLAWLAIGLMTAACSDAPPSAAADGGQPDDSGPGPDGPVGPVAGPEAVVGAVGSAGASVGIDAGGNALAVFYQRDEAGQDHVWASRYAVGSGWERAVPLEDNPGAPDTQNRPQIAVSASGHAMAVWSQLTSSGTYDVWARPYAPSAGWGTLERIEDFDRTAVSPRVAIDAEGNAIAAWKQSVGGPSRIGTNHFAVGAGWTKPALTIAAGSEDAVDFDPTIAFTPSGDALLVWTHGEDVYSLWTSTFSRGTWSAAEVLVPNDVELRLLWAPKLGIDSRGQGVLVWMQRDSTEDATYQNTLWFKRYATTWQEPREVLPPVPGEFDNVKQPSLAVGTDGTAAVVWRRNDLSIQASIAPPEGQWSTTPLKPPSNVEVDSLPVVAVDGKGGAFVSWGQKTGTNATADLYGSKYTKGAWSPGAVEVSAAESPYDPAVAMNEAGDRVLMWTRWVETGTQVVARYGPR